MEVSVPVGDGILWAEDSGGDGVAEVSRAVAMRLDGCPAVLVPGADHLLPLRAADRLAAAVAEAAGEP